MKRSVANKEICKNIDKYWTKEKKDFVQRRIRAAILKEVGKFELTHDANIQYLAHSMIPNKDTDGIIGHEERKYLKSSLRKYTRKTVLERMNLQKFFPELYNANIQIDAPYKENKEDDACKR